MKNALFVVYFSGRISSVCDYMVREAKEWTKSNTVVCLLLYAQPYSVFRNIIHPKGSFLYKKEKVFYLRMVYLLPFQRFYAISEINKWLFLHIVLPIVLKKIYTVKKLKKTVQRFFVYYRPEKEANYFNKVYQIFKAHGYKSLFNLVDYPPTEDAHVMDLYKFYIQQSDFVVANSFTLKKIFTKFRSNIIVVPQGFALKEYQNIYVSRRRGSSVSPVVGFIGALGSRLDYDLLSTLIERTPQWTYLFWGPLQMVEGDDKRLLLRNIKRLLGYKNVRHGVSTEEQKVATVLRGIDIAIIPYDVSQKSNRYCYPMKLFEYFYMGKPVVSTPIEELTRFDKYVRIGKSADEWNQHISSLLIKTWPDSNKQAQMKLAIENSWANKIYKISQVIKSS